MKRFLTILFLIALIAAPIKAQNTSFVFSGGVWTDDAFTTVGGGFLTGGIFNIDKSRNLSGRALYHQFYVGPKPAQSVFLSVMLTYSLGKDYDIYFNAGGEDYMGPDLASSIVGGIGGDKVIWSGDPDKFTVNPWAIKMFLEINWVNHNFETDGGSLRAFGGITFSPSVGL